MPGVLGDVGQRPLAAVALVAELLAGGLAPEGLDRTVGGRLGNLMTSPMGGR